MPPWLLWICYGLAYLLVGFVLMVVADAASERCDPGGEELPTAWWVALWLLWPIGCLLFLCLGFLVGSAQIGRLCRRRLNAGFLAAHDSTKRLGGGNER